MSAPSFILAPDHGGERLTVVEALLADPSLKEDFVFPEQKFGKDLNLKPTGKYVVWPKGFDNSQSLADKGWEFSPSDDQNESNVRHYLVSAEGRHFQDSAPARPTPRQRQAPVSQTGGSPSSHTLHQAGGATDAPSAAPGNISSILPGDSGEWITVAQAADRPDFKHFVSLESSGRYVVLDPTHPDWEKAGWIIEPRWQVPEISKTSRWTYHCVKDIHVACIRKVAQKDLAALKWWKR